MSVGRPSPQLWVDLLQYVGWASPIFVVDLVQNIGFQWLERIAPTIFSLKSEFIIFVETIKDPVTGSFKISKAVGI